MYPKADLTRILTLEAIEKGNEETYHPKTQSFTTQEDLATKQEIDNDAMDPTLSFIDWSGLEPLDETPVVEKPPFNPKLFKLNGEADSVSTLATDAMSVTFEDE